MKIKKSNTYIFMGILSAISLVVIVLGALASWQLYEVFAAKSQIAGTSKVTTLPGDDVEFVLNEDSQVFFSHNFNEIIFENENEIYSTDMTLEKLDYKPDDKDYVIFVNGKEVSTIKEAGMVSSQCALSFLDEHGDAYNAIINIDIKFFNNRSELKLYFTDKKVGGYINQMIKSGFNVRVVEQTIVEDNSHFESSGTYNLGLDYTLDAIYVNQEIKPNKDWFTLSANHSENAGALLKGTSGFSIEWNETLKKCIAYYKDLNGVEQQTLLFNGNYVYKDSIIIFPKDLCTINEINNEHQLEWEHWLSVRPITDEQKEFGYKLATPELKANPNGPMLEWEPIKFASHYDLIITGPNNYNLETQVNGTSYSFENYEPGEYLVFVVAQGNKNVVTNSESSHLTIEVEEVLTLKSELNIDNLYLDCSEQGEQQLKENYSIIGSQQLMFVNSVDPADVTISYLNTTSKTNENNSFILALIYDSFLSAIRYMIPIYSTHNIDSYLEMTDIKKGYQNLNSDGGINLGIHSNTSIKGMVCGSEYLYLAEKCISPVSLGEYVFEDPEEPVVPQPLYVYDDQNVDGVFIDINNQAISSVLKAASDKSKEIENSMLFDVFINENTKYHFGIGHCTLAGYEDAYVLSCCKLVKSSIYPYNFEYQNGSEYILYSSAFIDGSSINQPNIEQGFHNVSANGQILINGQPLSGKIQINTAPKSIFNHYQEIYNYFSNIAF